MSQARFDERKAEVRASATRLAEVVALPALGRMASRIEGLSWA
jgi:hypothetical protein